MFALQQYNSEAEWDVTRWERNYSKLSEQHKYVQAALLILLLVTLNG